MTIWKIKCSTNNLFSLIAENIVSGWIRYTHFPVLEKINMQNEIITAARGFLGTRFHHQGRLKKTDNHKGGIDCLGLLIGIAQELKLPFTQYDETDYSHYPDVHKLRQKLSCAMQEISKENIQAGDIILLNIDGNPQHLAIVSEISGQLAIIHAYAPARSVVEHLLDDWWRQRIVTVFRVIT